MFSSHIEIVGPRQGASCWPLTPHGRLASLSPQVIASCGKFAERRLAKDIAEFSRMPVDWAFNMLIPFCSIAA